jgi:hypothetical protein
MPVWYEKHTGYDVFLEIFINIPAYPGAGDIKCRISSSFPGISPGITVPLSSVFANHLYS